MTLLSSIWQRQVLSNGRRKCPLRTDFAIESFKCLKPDEHLVMGRESRFDVPPFACQFSKTTTSGHLLAVADEDGCVQLLNTKKYGPSSVVKDWTAHSNAIFDIAWMHDEPKLITASGDQTALLWDISRDDALAVFKGHSCSLKSVNFRDEDYFVFATGARDGNIMVWDLRCNRRDGFYQPVNIIHHAHTQQVSVVPQRNRRRGRQPSVPQPVSDSQQSVTSVVFQGENMLISSGAVDGNIKIWDLRKIYSSMRQKPAPCHIFPYPGTGTRKHGFSSLMLDSNQARLFASCTNDRIYMYNCASLTDKPICSYSGHLNSTFYVKAALSPDDQFILSGSSTNDAYIWRVDTPEAAPVLLKGHLGEVTSVAWCPTDQGKLVTCSDDNNLRIWRMIRRPPHGDNTFNMEIAGHCERSSGASPDIPSAKMPTSPSLEYTPPPSPLPHPSVPRTPRTTPVKYYTNPRLNQPASPVTMTTRISNTSFNTPPPQKTQSPLLPRNKDFSNEISPPRGMPDQTSSRGTEGSLAPFPVYDYDVPKSPLSVQSSPSHPPGSPQVEIKCKSPQQLLRTWLKKNPRKRPLEQESGSPTSLVRNEPQSRNVEVDYSKCLPSGALEHHSELFVKSSITDSSHLNCIESNKENKYKDDLNCAAIKENSPRSPQRKRLCVRSTNPEADDETLSQPREVDAIHSHRKRQILATIQESTENVNDDSINKVDNPSHFESKNVTVEDESSINDNWLTKLGKYMTVKYGIKEQLPAGEPAHQSDINNIPAPSGNGSSSPQPSRTSQKPSVLRSSCSTILTYFKPAVATS